MSRFEEGEHALGSVEGVSPVVICHILSVVFLHTQNPLAQTLQKWKRAERHILTHEQLFQDWMLNTMRVLAHERGR